MFYTQKRAQSGPLLVLSNVDYQKIVGTIGEVLLHLSVVAAKGFAKYVFRKMIRLMLSLW